MSCCASMCSTMEVYIFMLDYINVFYITPYLPGSDTVSRLSDRLYESAYI